MPNSMALAEIEERPAIQPQHRPAADPSLRHALDGLAGRLAANLDWLQANMPPYFFITMRHETEALAHLTARLHTLAGQRRVVVSDRRDQLIVALPDRPGTLYDTLSGLSGQEIAYAEIVHSSGPLPGSDLALEVQRFDFRNREPGPAAPPGSDPLPETIARTVRGALAQHYPQAGDPAGYEELLGCMWRDNAAYLRTSPPLRIARVLWLYRQTCAHDGLFCAVEPVAGAAAERRILLGLAHPPSQGFLTQVLEVFKRLEIGVRRAYSLVLEAPDGPCFLGTFYVRAQDGHRIEEGSERYRALQTELYNTQILAPESLAFSRLVRHRILTGPEAALQEAFIAFCHTTLAHGQPDRFDRSEIANAFYLHQDFAAALIRLFELRFAPEVADRDRLYGQARAQLEATIATYNTGNHRLDAIRRTVFRTGLLFIDHSLKTNFYVAEKTALAFRLDPAYLEALEAEALAGLPPERPYRITFFFSRHGIGYHIGFSDIARGGVRTVIGRSADELATATQNLFREVYVLAHTQHLKNKDIYEGGSKMTIVMDACDLEGQAAGKRRLDTLQYGMLNAFLDLFVTREGRAADPRVVDYYGQDEPIELGPDENLHDDMIERIARQAVKRGYRLGAGIISSKRVGINHKAYGVTSRGVIKAAEIAMREIGIDMGRDRFTVKLTGGPNGDVAGNSLRLLLERCPGVRIVSIVDGTAGVYDPEGIPAAALAPLLLRRDLEDLPAAALHPGGVMVFRRRTRQEGLRTLHLQQIQGAGGLKERWISADDLQRELQALTFTVAADLFLPCGGRPESLNADNVAQFLSPDGAPTARVVVEGANSYVSPQARETLQRQGVVLLRDATANKCGVISSSYEIIANLLMSDEEFLAHKEAYVADVLAILDRRAAEEAGLIFQRHRRHAGRRLYTEISADIGREINTLYGRLFDLFQARPGWERDPVFQQAFLNHLPAFIRERAAFRERLETLPVKIRCAILASEIASLVIYRDSWDGDLECRAREAVRAALG